jgi:hypothetical protein
VAVQQKDKHTGHEHPEAGGEDRAGGDRRPGARVAPSLRMTAESSVHNHQRPPTLSPSAARRRSHRFSSTEQWSDRPAARCAAYGWPVGSPAARRRRAIS